MKWPIHCGKIVYSEGDLYYLCTMEHGHTGGCWNPLCAEQLFVLWNQARTREIAARAWL